MYDTGDLAKYWSDGTIEFLGRSDNQIKLRGYRIELGEIEAALQTHTSVQQAVVVAREDAHRAKQLIGYVVPRKNTKVTPAKLRTHLARNLPEYMVPSSVVLCAEFPLTVNGKVDRRALAERRADPHEAIRMISGHAGHRKRMERRLAAIWAQVLGTGPFDRRDNFFELGGDSLMSVQVVALAAAQGIDIDPRHIFQFPTLAQLAEAARPTPLRHERTKSASSEIEGEVPLTPIQHWLFERDLRDPQNYNIAAVFDADGELDPRRLLAAIEEVAARHDAFRLRFDRLDGRWQQRLAESAVRCTHVNLKGRNTEDQNAAIRAMLYDLRCEQDLSCGPLLNSVLFELGRDWKLGVVVHHLIFDGVSQRIWIEQIQAAYAREKAANSGGSFCGWAQALAAFAETRSADSHADEWLAMPWASVEAMPLDFPGGQNTYASTAMVGHALNVPVTRTLLHHAPQVFGAGTGEILLAAWGRAMAAWADAPAVAVDVTGHGRDRFLNGVGVSGTIGYITTISPAVLQATNQVPEARPPEHSWGVSRYLRASSNLSKRLAALPSRQVKFNYQGQTNSAGFGCVLSGPTAVPIRGSMHPENTRAYALNVELMVSDGRLRCQCVYSQHLHRTERIETLLGMFVDELNGVASQVKRGASAVMAEGARA